jgi:hypothetical protein
VSPRDRAIFVVLGAAAFVAANAAEGQQTSCFGPECGPRSAAELAAGLRKQAEQGRIDHRVLFTLVQLYGPHPAEELEALADSLAAVGIDLAVRPGPHGYTIGRLAANALTTAATWRSAAPDERGVAFPGAADRAVEVAYRLPGGDVGILNLVRPVIGDERWVAHLRRFTSDLYPGAALAVVHLQADAPQGLEVLRDLCEDGLVTEPRARWRLREIAKSMGWAPGIPHSPTPRGYSFSALDRSRSTSCSASSS